MLAISRALLLNPRLLVMDEPTEGLAPMIVRRVEDMLTDIAEEGEVNVLVIEQNIGVACTVSNNVGIMVNGRIDRVIESTRLASDRNLQQTLLGVGRHARDEAAGSRPERSEATPGPAGPDRIYLSNPVVPTRWSQPVPARVIEQSARTSTTMQSLRSKPAGVQFRARAPSGLGALYVAGTLDTKADEVNYIRDRLKDSGLHARLVDLSTSGKMTGADVPAHEVAAYHPRGTSGVFTGVRGTAIAGMTVAFERWTRRRSDIGGMIGAGGSGATSMIAPAMRSLAIGIPKVLVSTVASGDVSKYVGPADITMIHSVADVQGLNAITREVLSNAAGAFAGMVRARKERNGQADGKTAIGLTMFGVTTPCVQMITERLGDRFDCLVFHATGVGGRSMEHLLDSGLLAGVVDITTTEICDMVAGGVFAADSDRFGASIRTGLPYIGSCGALDMVNFGAIDTLPRKYRGRLVYEHNPQVTLMRTTPEECTEIGRWIGGRLNEMNGPVRFFLPEGGVSDLDRPGAPFWSPEANSALFTSLEETVQTSSERRLVRVPTHVNDPEFARMVADTSAELMEEGRGLGARRIHG